jgi:hypothetical protein
MRLAKRRPGADLFFDSTSILRSTEVGVNDKEHGQEKVPRNSSAGTRHSLAGRALS